MRKTPVSANPGDQFEYNNVIYGLIGDIMASITGKPLETALKEYLFKPLGMDHACIGLPALLEACDRFYPYMDDPMANAPRNHKRSLVWARLAASQHWSRKSCLSYRILKWGAKFYRIFAIA